MNTAGSDKRSMYLVKSSWPTSRLIFFTINSGQSPCSPQNSGTQNQKKELVQGASRKQAKHWFTDESQSSFCIQPLPLLPLSWMQSAKLRNLLKQQGRCDPQEALLHAAACTPETVECHFWTACRWKNLMDSMLEALRRAMTDCPCASSSTFSSHCNQHRMMLLM